MQGLGFKDLFYKEKEIVVQQDSGLQDFVLNSNGLMVYFRYLLAKFSRKWKIQIRN